MDSPLFLGHATAAYYLLHNGVRGLRRSHSLPRNGLGSSSARIGEARDALGLPREARLDECVLVEQDKRKSAGRRSHICRYASEGDYLCAGDNVYIATPKLAFLQLADTLSVPELVLLGLELCGTYVSEDGEFSRDKPLASVCELREYVGCHDGARGARKAREALRFIADGSASPRESQLFVLLCLSQKWGGYGLPAPMLNARIDLTSQQRRVAGRGHLRCDLFWSDAQLAVEYDSDAFHTGSTKINGDSLRRNVLRSAGVSVIDVTNGQLKKAEALHEIALQVDHLLNSDAICRRKPGWMARNAMLRQLVINESALDRLC